MHHPSGKFAANAAWLVIATLAHNLLRWTQRVEVLDAPQLRPFFDAIASPLFGWLEGNAILASDNKCTMVLVRDVEGNGVPGVPVVFAVTSGGEFTPRDVEEMELSFSRGFSPPEKTDSRSSRLSMRGLSPVSVRCVIGGGD